MANHFLTKAADLSANEIGRRIRVTAVSGVVIEDEAREIRFFGPQSHDGLTAPDPEDRPQVWVRFKNACSTPDARSFASADAGFFVAADSEVTVTK